MVSALIAITAAHITLDLSSRIPHARSSRRTIWLMSGAVAMGTGVWSMHFVAMLAFSIEIPIVYDLGIVLLSLIIAILAAALALAVISRPYPTLKTISGGGVLIGLGIAAMHYSGMAAMQMPAHLSYQPIVFALSIGVAILVAHAAVFLSIQFRAAGRAAQVWTKPLVAALMGGAVLAMHYTAMAAAVFTPAPQHVIIEASHLDNASLVYLVCCLTFIIILPLLCLIYIQPQQQPDSISNLLPSQPPKKSK